MNEMTLASSTHRHVRPSTAAIVGFLAAIAVSVGLPSTAHAGSRLGLDLDYVNAVNNDDVSGGKGLALRYGYKLDLIVVSITPEVGGGIDWFGGAAEPRLLNGFVGGRVSFLKGIEPGVFAHIGYGSMKVLDESRGGSTLDGGLTLDFTMLPFIDLGLHAAYDVFLVKDEDAFKWYRLGAHAALAF